MTSTIGQELAAQVAVRGDSTMLVCDDDRLTYADAERRVACARPRPGGDRRGPGNPCRHPLPDRRRLRRRWLAVTRIGAVAVPISTFSTGDELRGLLADADIDVLLTIDAYRGHDYVDRLLHAVGADVTPTRRVRCHRRGTFTSPRVRRRRLADAVAGRSPIDRSGRRRCTVDDTRLDAIEADVSPADRMVIVLHVGIHQHTQGCHPPARRRSSGTSGNLNQLRGLHRGGEAVLEFTAVLDRRSRVQRRRHAGRRLDARVLDVRRRRRHARPHRARAPGLVNGFVQSIANLVTRSRRSRRATSRRSDRATSIRSCPTPCDPPTPSCATTCSA